MSLARLLTFCLIASALDRSLLVFFEVQPAANSGPRDVSEVNVCLVPRLDSNKKPGN